MWPYAVRFAWVNLTVCWCEHHNLFLWVQSDRMRSQDCVQSWPRCRLLKCVQAFMCILRQRYLKTVSFTLQSRPRTIWFLAISDDKECFVWREVCDRCRTLDCCPAGAPGHSCQGVREKHDAEIAGTNAGMHNQLQKILKMCLLMEMLQTLTRTYFK